jgi:hypothetical protein
MDPLLFCDARLRDNTALISTIAPRRWISTVDSVSLSVTGIRLIQSFGEIVEC